MDTRHLIAFERIAREGSFSRAAEALGISQATISGRIQALEAEIGATLFVRGGRAVTLTGAGETFLPFVRRALAVLAEGVESARLDHTGRYGRVTVGAIDSVADGLLVPVISRFQASHPEIILSVRTGHTPQIIEEIVDGTVRLGFVTWSYVQGTNELDVLLRVRERLVAVAHPRHPLAGEAEVSIQRLIRDAAPYHETPWGTLGDARLAGAAQRSWPDHELPHGLIRRLILQGHGAGFLPASLVAQDLADGTLEELPVSGAAGLGREIALVCHESAALLPPAAHDFALQVRESVEVLAPLGLSLVER